MKSGGSSSGPKTAGAYGNSGTQTPAGPAPSSYAWNSYLPSDPMASAQLGDPTVQRYSDGSEAPATATLLPAADVAAPTTTSNSSAMKALLAKLIAQNAKETTDALDGGYFSGTNARRQQLLRQNRGYREGGPGDSASGGSKASGSFGGGGDAWGGLR